MLNTEKNSDDFSEDEVIFKTKIFDIVNVIRSVKAVRNMFDTL